MKTGFKRSLALPTLGGLFILTPFVIAQEREKEDAQDKSEHKSQTQEREKENAQDKSQHRAQTKEHAKSHDKEHARSKSPE